MPRRHTSIFKKSRAQPQRLVQQGIELFGGLFSFLVIYVFYTPPSSKRLGVQKISWNFCHALERHFRRC